MATVGRSTAHDDGAGGDANTASSSADGDRAAATAAAAAAAPVAAPAQHPSETATVVGLELKERFAAMLLRGDKTVELRRYAAPPRCLNRPVLLLATPDGAEGASTLPADVLPPDHPGVTVAGTVVFCEQRRYATFEEFAADAPRHRVPADGSSPYGWQPGATRELWGWVVRAGSARPAAADGWDARRRPPMRRTLSSWFEGEAYDEQAAASSGADVV